MQFNPKLRFPLLTVAIYSRLSPPIKSITIANFSVLPDGWFIFGSKKLKVFPERKTWGQARKYCQTIGGDLALIYSRGKNELIAHLLERFITNATKG